jgi:KaiC/GvpD/RAD55 family RecA-like ATPase
VGLVVRTHTERSKSATPTHSTCVLSLPKIPLVEELTKGPVPPGSALMVEFMGASQWFNASLTIAAGWITTGGKVAYSTYAQSPDDVRAKLKHLGLDTETLEREGTLRILDSYTTSLGQKSIGEYVLGSLKVADLSLEFSQTQMRGPPAPELLRISDNNSVIARFNDEKAWVEFRLTRGIPLARKSKSTGIAGVLKGVHSSWAYEHLESASDGVIDFELDATKDPPINLIRIRSIKNAAYDGRWHTVKIGENFKVALEE